LVKYSRISNKATVQLTTTAPVNGRQAHVPTVTDDVDELGVGPELVEGDHNAHIAGGFVAHQVFAVLVAVEVEDAGDEVPVQHGIAGSEQSFKGFAIELQLGEPRVVEQKRDQLIGYVTVKGQPDPILEPTGDPAGFVDDRYVRVGVDHPPEERRTRPLTAHDKDVGVSVEPIYRLHCSHSRSGCFFTIYVPPWLAWHPRAEHPLQVFMD
jgi:hypothetical protein